MDCMLPNLISWSQPGLQEVLGRMFHRARECLDLVAVTASVRVGASPLTRVLVTAAKTGLQLSSFDREGQDSGGRVLAGRQI